VFAFLQVVHNAAAILYELKFYKLRILSDLDFDDKFAGLKSLGLVFGIKFPVYFTIHFKSHSRLVMKIFPKKNINKPKCRKNCSFTNGVRRGKTNAPAARCPRRENLFEVPLLCTAQIFPGAQFLPLRGAFW